jgi:hypothetical protein
MKTTSSAFDRKSTGPSRPYESSYNEDGAKSPTAGTDEIILAKS